MSKRLDYKTLDAIDRAIEELEKRREEVKRREQEASKREEKARREKPKEVHMIVTEIEEKHGLAGLNSAARRLQTLLRKKKGAGIKHMDNAANTSAPLSK